MSGNVRVTSSVIVFELANGGASRYLCRPPGRKRWVEILILFTRERCLLACTLIWCFREPECHKPSNYQAEKSPSEAVIEISSKTASGSATVTATLPKQSNCLDKVSQRAIRFLADALIFIFYWGINCENWDVVLLRRRRLVVFLLSLTRLMGSCFARVTIPYVFLRQPIQNLGA